MMNGATPSRDNACDCDGGEKSPKTPSSPRRRKNYIPYSTIYESQDDVRKKGYWIPVIPVDAHIVKVEKDHSSGYHIMNPFLYTIELHHGKFRWRVVKRYKDFSYLSHRLLAHRAMERVRRPVRRAREKIEEAIEGEENDNENAGEPIEYELHNLSRDHDLGDFPSWGNGNISYDEDLSPVSEVPDDMSRTDFEGLPHFPMVPDSMIAETHMQDRKERLEHWIRKVLSTPINRNYHETAEFLEVSRYSFINQLGGKYKEGKVKKRPGGGKVYTGIKQFCARWFVPWGKRWLVVKDTYVCYMNPSNENIRLVLLFDEQFEINPPGLVDIRPKEIILANLQHVLTIKCSREEETLEWKDTIQKVLNETGKIWREEKRFGSSYPIRRNGHCQWFVDAKDYWEKASSMIELAQEEIFIADWWLCPEVYMRRPMAEGNHWRLDYILKRQAEKGVRIFILVYKEMEMALTLNSLYSKKLLQGLHENIKVMRHPDHYVGTGTFMWAHHEKLLIIDQLIAFVGGLDLCWGRWDDSRHVLTDLGSVQFSPRQAGELSVAKGLVGAVGAATASMVNDSNANFDEKVLKQAFPHEVRREKEDVFDEEGNKTGERITTKIDKITATPAGKSLNVEYNKRKNFREAMSKVMQRRKAANEHLSSTTDVAKQRSHSHSPQTRGSPRSQSHSPQPKARDATPFDNVPGSGRAAAADGSSTGTGSTSAPLAPGSRRERRFVSAEPDGTASKERVRRFRNLVAALDRSASSAGDRSRADTGEQKTVPLPMEPHQRTLMRRVISSLKTPKAKTRWRLPLEAEDTTDEYVLNYCKIQDNSTDLTDLRGAGKLWPGKDYVNYLVKDFVEVDQAFSDFINRYDTPRMPWHDIHSVVYGDAARDVARHFIQRWNATKTEKLKGDDKYPYLLPKSYDSVRVPRVFLNKDTHPVEIQVLRSVSHWSLLFDRKEDSIQQAYLSLIANAQHYIYIENQFFVSMIGSAAVENEICQVLCQRIVRAHRDNETFRIFVLLPMLPGFEGDIGAANYSALLAVMHWTYLSISKGPNSLIENLKKNGVEDPWKYITFNGLRTHDELCGKLVTEFIYVHCKLMIVDDMHTIIGSANINDRSQTGDRDSEVCVLVTDKEFVPSTMNGQPYQAGRFASSLRKRLMQEHLGMLDESTQKASPDFKIKMTLDDPVSDSFYYDIWRKVAETNTRIFEEVFRCYPTDLVTSFEELVVWRNELSMAQYNPDLARSTLEHVMGNLVHFPVYFLKQEDLTPTITTKEGLVPSAIFT